MISSSFASKLLLLSIAALALPTSMAFQVSRSPLRLAPVGTLTPHFMSAEPFDQDRIGPTEQMLLEAKERRERRERGHVQEIGKTVRGDHLDGVRAMVWSIYGVSNYVFGGLGALLFLKMALNLAGYGFFVDAGGSFVMDTLEHIRQEQFFAAEAARLVADASEGVKNLM